MDSKEFIESGAIEAYVLGLASPEEMAEVDRLRVQDPAINEAILDFELKLESGIMANTMPVPAFVKEDLKQKLRPEFKKEEGRVVQMPLRPVNKAWAWVAAASLVLLLGSAVFNYYLYDKLNKKDDSYASLSKEMNAIRTQNQLANAKIEEMHNGMTMMSDPAVAKVNMPGMGTHLTNKAMVLWDSRTKNVYLMPMDLPQAPKGKQYQLWAMVDGKPVDAGMMENCTVLCNMKNIPSAQAFAITLEKQGGSPAPDLTQLYVMGKTTP